MDKIEDWKRRPDVKKWLNASPEDVVELSINRDPMRALHYCHNHFLSPADGFVLYAKEVEPTEEIIKVKGGEYTVNTLFREEFKERCLIIGIFMTAYDVHINRIPTDGFVTYQHLLPLHVLNLSMRETETDIIDRLHIVKDNLKYAFYNERMKNKIFCQWIKQHYYILQIADFEVDCIVQFKDQNYGYTQGERFSLVRLGSQVELLIPFTNPKVKYECLIPQEGIIHVEAGIDKLVKILR